jgi:DNA polymerase-3 subunit gamma/tau
MDVLEIDAASNTGVDDVRGTIVDSINFNPARDRYKVFIIDEIHMLSRNAFNALLKTLEEPPSNVIFIMATTELHKVPETILSRCQEFEFRTIPLQKIFDRLKLIAGAEKIDISDDALRELARSGEGSMRDAQSNFDQVISFSSDKISAADVTNALGFAGVEILTKTINAIAAREPKAILAVVDDILARGHDLRNFCRDLLGLFRDLLVFKVAAGDKHLFEGAVFNEEEMHSMAESFTEPDLLRFFNSLCDTEASLREAAHPRYVLEIGLVKLIEMRSVATIESILERLNALSTGAPIQSVPRAAATGTQHSSSPSADKGPEKKTLKSEPSAFIEPPLSEPFDEPTFVGDLPPDEPIVTKPAIVEKYIPPPSRLPSLSSEELEHTDDPRLDDAYEEKLKLSGDNLLPITNIGTIVEAFLGIRPASAANVTPKAASNGSTSTAVAPAFDVAKFKEEFVPKEENVELPALSSDPTEAELIEYANAHATVRLAKRVFRAKIVEVRKA